MEDFILLKKMDPAINSNCQINYCLEQLIGISKGLSILISNAVPKAFEVGISKKSIENINSLLDFAEELQSFIIESLISESESKIFTLTEKESLVTSSECQGEILAENLIRISKALSTLISYGMPEIIDGGCSDNRLQDIRFLLSFNESLNSFLIEL